MGIKTALKTARKSAFYAAQKILDLNLPAK
jgi:hypothetical protein